MEPNFQFSAAVQDAERHRRAGELLAVEAATAFVTAQSRIRELRAGASPLALMLQASGATAWHIAPDAETQSQQIGQRWGRRPRLTGVGFFTEDTLCGTRALTVAGQGTALVSTAAPGVSIGVPGGASGFLPLCAVVRARGAIGDPIAARFDALPTVTVLASETSQAADSTPTVSASATAPTNISTHISRAKRWVLQTEGGADAVKELILNALRVKAMQQIIEGSGSDGQALGLVNDSAVPGAAGTTLAMSHVATACEAVEASVGNSDLVWVVTAAAAKILRQRAEVTSGPAILHDGRIAGYPAIVIGGTSSAHAVLGRWADLTVREFSPLELAVNPFTNFQADIIGVRGWFSFAAAPLVNASFYKITSIT